MPDEITESTASVIVAMNEAHEQKIRKLAQSEGENSLDVLVALRDNEDADGKKGSGKVRSATRLQAATKLIDLGKDDGGPMGRALKGLGGSGSIVVNLLQFNGPGENAEGKIIDIAAAIGGRAVEEPDDS